eukprot:CAMPEP_0198262274 /NCGR_PEP_ID=MMETSP1447-20131203/10814_1 /TAXON_ID=420782 /ORGANISM="Chaetoceros dichaeta, Strain CCMP1751" /LENGTH=481 /DNA_ID=CAMNT_0043950457 /DNA_START=145 /DNA_END=1590 /DNA_ORIENTATION=+
MTAYGIIPVVIAPISVISSSIIIIMVLRSREKLNHMYHRLMVGFSTADIFVSAAMSFSSLPGPQDNPSPKVWKSIGSQGTCDAQGFFFMLGSSSAPLYFLSLQIYYLCVIKYEMNLEEIKKIEPFLHGVPVLIGLISAIVPLATESMNPGYSWCWVQSFPLGCNADPNVECTRGAHASIQRWVFVGAPLIIILVIASVVMWMIYNSVRTLDQLNASHDFRSTTVNDAQSKRADEDRQSSRSSIPASIGSIVTSVVSYFEPLEPRVAARYRRSQQARERIFQYYIGYLLTICFPLLYVPIAITGISVDVLEVLTFIFYPLQGFFNMMVFILPNLKKVRRRHTEMSLPCVFATAIITYIGPSRVTPRRFNSQIAELRLQQNEIENEGPTPQRTGSLATYSSNISDEDSIMRQNDVDDSKPQHARGVTFDSPSMCNEVSIMQQNSADNSEPQHVNCVAIDSPNMDTEVSIMRKNSADDNGTQHV